MSMQCYKQCNAMILYKTIQHPQNKNVIKQRFTYYFDIFEK